MPRKLKYGEETKTIGFRVPLSKIEAVTKLVEEYLNQLSINKIIQDVAFTHNEITSAYKIDINWGCGCVVVDGLLRRGKGSKCKLTKSEH